MIDPMASWWPPRRPAICPLGQLFCFPYAGGGASMYATWAAYAPRELAIVPVQLPGREHRAGEIPVSNLKQLIDWLTAVVAPVATPPYSFFGHSMGALVAFELARALRRLGHAPPAHLFASGRGAPGAATPTRQIHMLPDREFLGEIARLRGTPAAVLEHPEFVSLFLPALRADFAMVETYACAPESPLSTPISVFGGVDDDISRDGLEAWRAHTTSAFRLRLMPGGHFFLHSSRDAILRAVAEDLAMVR
jgi:medium-chain acyl-[acyl-carrier-protein] hydrolase